MDIFLTIDVDVYYTGDYDLEVRGHGHGLDFLIQSCAQRGLRSTYFVDAMGATRWGMEPVRRVCGMILEAGQEVQLHVHPVVAQLEGFTDENDLLREHDVAEQRLLIAKGMEILDACGAPHVTAFRAGALAADRRTLEAMEQLGVALGSNRDLDLKSSLESRLNELFPVGNDISRLGGVTDLPVSALRSAFPMLDGPYRHLEVCAMGTREMCDALQKLDRAGVRCVTILTHPKEFFYMIDGHAVPVPKNKQRWTKLIDYLAGHSSWRIRTVSQCLDGVDLPASAPAIPRLNPAYSLARVVAQGRERLRKRRLIG